MVIECLARKAEASVELVGVRAIRAGDGKEGVTSDNVAGVDG